MYIGNIVVWKHRWRLETYIGYWKQKKDIGNMQKRFETYSVCWKHYFSLETYIYWKHIMKNDYMVKYTVLKQICLINEKVFSTAQMYPRNIKIQIFTSSCYLI